MKTLQHDSNALRDFLTRHPRLVVLTGAGISADSGIPTYRDARGTWLHREPIQHQDFLSDEGTRRRYWARSRAGWPAVRDAIPNPAHFALARLERQGHIDLLITQNVDRLHQRAGSSRVVDLHGRLDRVRCLGCDRLHGRDSVQHILEAGNDWQQHSRQSSRPDGDAEVPEALSRQLDLPRCQACSGDLMPDVVFFGGSVPRERVETCFEALESADALLAIGSSLRVYSGYRFCRHARKLGKPLAIINPGITRADDIACLNLSSTAGALLGSVAGLADRSCSAAATSSPGNPS